MADSLKIDTEELTLLLVVWSPEIGVAWNKSELLSRSFDCSIVRLNVVWAEIGAPFISSESSQCLLMDTQSRSRCRLYLQSMQLR